MRVFEGNQLHSLTNRLRGAFVGRDEIVQRACDAYRASNQAITSGVLTAISFTAVHKDTDNMWSNGAPTRITVQVAGWYVISAEATFEQFDQIDSIQITNGGSGFTSEPSVSFSVGTGATAYAVVRGGQVVDIVVTSGGLGYTGASTFSLSGGGGSGVTGVLYVGVRRAERLISIRLNGGSSIAVNNYIGRGDKNTYMSCSRVIYLNSGDYLELVVLHDGPSTRNILQTAYSPILSLARYP